MDKNNEEGYDKQIGEEVLPFHKRMAKDLVATSFIELTPNGWY